MFREGQQIGGYTLIAKLGRGGFGEVWLAEKRSQFVTKKVAVKLPLDEQINFDAIRQEAGLWEQASGHPNVLPIIDADVIDGQVVIVSEYADGGSLADRIRREGRLPLQKTVEMVIGILSGLEFLHSRRIIHRDIKPQNILLQGDTPRLADFGISRAMNTTVISSAIIGTDAYMSPESFDGKRTVQTDIWSVGVVLYALLADRLPFPQEHPSERMFAILTKEFAPLPPEVPQNLQRIVQKALAKQPENRYRTTTEMRDELQKVLIGINHPTFAPTEVFQIRTENLPTIPTLENRYETGEPEKETIVSPQNINIPAPTEVSFQPPSVVTNFKQTPPVTGEPAFSPPRTNQPPAVQFQMSGNQTPDRPAAVSSSNNIWENTPLRFVMAIAIAIITVLAIGFVINFGKKRPTLSNSANNANNSSSVVSKTSPVSTSTRYNANENANNNANGNANENANATLPVSTAEMKFELESPRRTPLITTVDGKVGYSYLEPDKIIKLSAQKEVDFALSEKDISLIKFRINGKTITLPTGPAIKESIQFTVDKTNLDRILQSGKITDVKSLPAK